MLGGIVAPHIATQMKQHGAYVARRGGNRLRVGLGDSTTLTLGATHTNAQSRQTYGRLVDKLFSLHSMQVLGLGQNDNIIQI